MKKHVVFFFLILVFAISCKNKIENKFENSFENQFKLSFVVDSNMGEVNVKIDGKNIKSKAMITAGKVVSFKAMAKNGYCVDYWRINKENKYTEQEEIKIKIEKDTNVVLYFKAKPKMCKLIYSFNKDEGSLIAQENGIKIESETSIKNGTRVIFKATPNKDFFISNWTLNNKPVNNVNPTYELEIKEDSYVKVNFSKKIKEEIQVEKIVIGKIEYLNKIFPNKKELNILENGKEKILISESKIDIKVYIETPKNVNAKLIIDDNIEEELEENCGVFEKKGILMDENFKSFKLTFSKEGYIEKNYSFKAKKITFQNPLIPENLRIKKLFVNIRPIKPSKCIEPSNNGLDYNIEFSNEYVGNCFFLWILGEEEEAIFKDENVSGISDAKANGKNYEIITPLPDKNQNKTFVIALTYKDEKFKYNLNVRMKEE